MQARENDFNQIRNEEFANKVQAKDDRVTLRLDLNWSVGGFIREKEQDEDSILTILRKYLRERPVASSLLMSTLQRGIQLLAHSKSIVMME
ncbi:uncharacterized protein [Prorops nasuta]|uniref:uncharacterized protein isoform X2 n=1 Tax=Prorops nasuta TaxID=863751 RepID=UPI0034CD3106